ncbi:hypothetical protein [Priestia abyssalis]|uniref:hypothetical protein n=1 Tax=Priestia abyssalis TaxID=1221450 RepID=UPI000994E64B|nr:hypothetical protein [Priestia abyssalis]
MKQRVEAEINRLVTIFVKDQASDGSWSYPVETGISTDCYMIILLRTLEINDEELIQLSMGKCNHYNKKKGWVKKVVYQRPFDPASL